MKLKNWALNGELHEIIMKKKERKQKKKTEKKVKKKEKNLKKNWALVASLIKVKQEKKKTKKKESGPITLWTSVDTNIFVCCVIVHRK